MCSNRFRKRASKNTTIAPHTHTQDRIVFMVSHFDAFLFACGSPNGASSRGRTTRTLTHRPVHLATSSCKQENHKRKRPPKARKTYKKQNKAMQKTEDWRIRQESLNKDGDMYAKVCYASYQDFGLFRPSACTLYNFSKRLWTLKA